MVVERVGKGDKARRVARPFAVRQLSPGRVRFTMPRVVKVGRKTVKPSRQARLGLVLLRKTGAKRYRAVAFMLPR